VEVQERRERVGQLGATWDEHLRRPRPEPLVEQPHVVLDLHEAALGGGGLGEGEGPEPQRRPSRRAIGFGARMRAPSSGRDLRDPPDPRCGAYEGHRDVLVRWRATSHCPSSASDIVDISVSDDVTALGFAPRPSDDAFLTLALGVDRDTKGTGSRG